MSEAAVMLEDPVGEDVGLVVLPPPEDAFDTDVDTAERVMLYDQGSKKYWWKNASSEWIGRTRVSAQNMLKQHEGLYGSAVKGEKISPVERKLLDVEENHFVTYAGPLAGWKQGFYMQDGQPILVTRSPHIPDPEPGEWPTLKRMFDCLLAGTELPKEDADHDRIVDQRPYFFAWWRFSLQCLQSCYPERGLAMVLAGDAGCGKTLLKEMVRLSFGGREVYPYSFMIGRDNFNAEMLEGELWTIDDETADTSILARVKFGAELKKVTANSATRFRGMMREAVTLTTFKRAFLCVNREPERLMVLPPMDDDIKGKVALLLAHNSTMFQQVELHNTGERKAFWKTLNEELPHFMYWLLHEWDPGEYANARFGSREYHHPELAEELFTLSPEQILLDQIDRTFKHMAFFDNPLNERWTGSAKDLRDLLSAEDGPLSSSEIKKLPAPNWLARKYLKKLASRFPNQFTEKRASAGNIWTIWPDRQEVSV